MEFLGIEIIFLAPKLHKKSQTSISHSLIGKALSLRNGNAFLLINNSSERVTYSFHSKNIYILQTV